MPNTLRRRRDDRGTPHPAACPEAGCELVPGHRGPHWAAGTGSWHDHDLEAPRDFSMLELLAFCAVFFSCGLAIGLGQ